MPNRLTSTVAWELDIPEEDIFTLVGKGDKDYPKPTREKGKLNWSTVGYTTLGVVSTGLILNVMHRRKIEFATKDSKVRIAELSNQVEGLNLLKEAAESRASHLEESLQSQSSSFSYIEKEVGDIRNEVQRLRRTQRDEIPFSIESEIEETP